VRVVRDLESSADGCKWLLDRWAELHSLLDLEQAWQSPDKLKAIRLLGRQPIDAFDDPKVGLVFLACHKIDPSGGELFHEIWNELRFSEIAIAARSRPFPRNALGGVSSYEMMTRWKGRRFGKSPRNPTVRICWNARGARVVLSGDDSDGSRTAD
jgi:hypothetical protein